MGDLKNAKSVIKPAKVDDSLDHGNEERRILARRGTSSTHLHSPMLICSPYRNLLWLACESDDVEEQYSGYHLGSEGKNAICEDIWSAILDHEDADDIHLAVNKGNKVLLQVPIEGPTSPIGSVDRPPLVASVSCQSIPDRDLLECSLVLGYHIYNRSFIGFLEKGEGIKVLRMLVFEHLRAIYLSDLAGSCPSAAHNLDPEMSPLPPRSSRTEDESKSMDAIYSVLTYFDCGICINCFTRVNSSLSTGIPHLGGT